MYLYFCHVFVCIYDALIGIDDLRMKDSKAIWSRSHEERILLDLRRRTVILRHPERAQKEGTAGPKRRRYTM